MATTKILTINNRDFVNDNIASALEFFEHELKWDAVMNHRAIYINFEGINDMNELEVTAHKLNWYKNLLTERPEYIYYITPEQFNEILPLLLETGDLNVNHSAVRDKNMKVYLLQTLEDLSNIYGAPKELMDKVYKEVASI